MKKKLLLGGLLFLVLTSCSSVEKTEDFVSGVKNIRGEVIQPLNTTVFLRTYNKQVFNNLFPSYKQIIQRIHKESDRYNEYSDYSDIYKLNRGGYIQTNDEVIEMLENVLEFSSLTDYKFNPALGPLIDVWTPLFNNSNNNDPSSVEINDALGNIPLTNIEDCFDIDKDAKTIRRLGENITLDLGAYAKGYALGKAYEAFKDDDNPLMIYAGGSSIILKGTKPYANGNWIIDIDNPDNFMTSIAQLYLQGTNYLSTSGDYQRYFINESGIRRHHILNPFTGYPADNYRSITVYADGRADILDALTTALFNCENDEEFLELISKVEERYSINIEFVYVKESVDGLYLGVSEDAEDVIKNPKVEVRVIK